MREASARKTLERDQNNERIDKVFRERRRERVRELNEKRDLMINMETDELTHSHNENARTIAEQNYDRRRLSNRGYASKNPQMIFNTGSPPQDWDKKPLIIATYEDATWMSATSDVFNNGLLERCLNEVNNKLFNLMHELYPDNKNGELFDYTHQHSVRSTSSFGLNNAVFGFNRPGYTRMYVSATATPAFPPSGKPADAVGS